MAPLPPPLPAPVGRKKRVALTLDDVDATDAAASQSVVTAGVMRASAAGAATVSVSDCLACSGCVTSAETVLLSRNSVAAFIALLENREVVVSLPHVALASLAESGGANTNATFAALRALLLTNFQTRVHISPHPSGVSL